MEKQSWQYERIRELEQDLEEQREWNLGLVRAIHDRLDAAGVSTSHHSVGQRVQALIEERDRLNHENEMLHKDRELLHQTFDDLGVPRGSLVKRLGILTEKHREEKNDLRALADTATEEEQKLRKENADLCRQRNRWENEANRQKKHNELLNDTLKNERERRKEAQKMARTLRDRFEEFEEVILYHPHAPVTHTGIRREEWLKTRLIEKLRDLRWRPM